MQKIIPFLWFDGQAEEAANFYTSIFRNSKIGKITRYNESGSKASGMPEGSPMTVEFQIEGQDFVALNGGPEFKFSEAVSFAVTCENQEEIDELWQKLTEGGDEKSQICGWLKDKYGLSWQIVPKILPEMLQGQDPQKAERVMGALMKMKKIEIAELEKAYSGE